jgi:hypothetical protein
MPFTVLAMFGCKSKTCRLRRQMGGSRDSLPAGPEVRAAAADFQLSTGETLLEASESRVLVLVFLRHFGCTFTRQILCGLEQIHHLAVARGAQLVLVHMLKSGSELRYLSSHNGVARIADPQCELYRSFGLRKGGFTELLGPRVWWLGFLSVFKGCGVGYLAGNGRQMPGAFLFHRGEILASQRAKSASDLPDLPGLFDTVQSAGTRELSAAP